MLILLAIAFLGSVPIAFVGRTPTFVFGLPVWLWSSVVFTAAVAVLTAWAFLRFWRDDELD